MKSIKRLQLIQNAAARLIRRTKNRAHMTLVLRDLHWLPVVKRCQFKILVCTYKSLKNEAPSYIYDLLNWYQPNRPLRSANTTSIIPKRYTSVQYGKRLMDSLLVGYEPADLTVNPPPQNCREWVHFFRMGV